MSDPLSISAGILGIVGIAAQIDKLLNDYVGSVRSASEEAHTVKMEVVSIHSVLQRLVGFLDDAADEISINFAKECVLCSAIEECNQILTRLHRVFGKTLRAKKSGIGKEIIERLKWPLKKEDCEKEMQHLRRLLQIFEFSLSLSTWYVPSRWRLIWLDEAVKY
jgi:hypothetical protein